MRVVALFGLTPVLPLLLIAEWVYLDAAARGSRLPGLWAVGSVFGGPVGLYYLFVYRRREERERPPTPVESWFRLLAPASMLAFAASGFLAPPDPVSAGLYTLAGLAAFTPALAVVRRLTDAW